MTKFRCIDPFDIDNGELNEISPQMIFTLGVEWQMFREQLLGKKRRFSMMVHLENVERLKAMCNRHKCKVFEQRENDDWTSLRVEFL